ncbi:calponin homology domain-containing protein DDB_G0272472 [Scaptodrosophila lebanonensis]|uniref:Calponin homology domain-containing protein DDB_G0272472 n=1 Tax=Drosophila lebanonensis TaxID=7225 RepID=A0A6J2U8J5_DROLE|nr:calponin homology domain-containing protein DDB_G0272472 [Scaptodrosophila lebanonensis]
MSLWKSREKSYKDTRWDRIRKRHQNTNTLALKTDAVRRLIETDYIGKHNERLLIEGEPEPSKKLNPSVIMDIRHEMFQQIPRKLPLATVANRRNLDLTRAHNLEVEQRYINNQLQQFRQHLAKKHRNIQDFRIRPTKPDFKLNNRPLMQSLTQAAQHIEDFYATPVQALSQAMEMCGARKQAATSSLLKELTAEKDADMENFMMQQETWVQNVTLTDKKLAVEEETTIDLDTLEYRNFAKQVQVDESKALLERCRTPSPLTPTDEFFKPMRAAAERQMLHIRTVRREEDLAEQAEKAQHKLEREPSTCSNTSDGIDSVISDLAEEALYELQMEAAEEQKEQVETALTVLEPVATPAPAAKHVQFQIDEAEAKQLKKAPTPIEELEPLLITRMEPRVVVKPKEPEPENTGSTTTSDADDLDDEGEMNVHEKKRIIGQLFQARANSQLVTMRKYFLKWIHYTTIERIERENGKTRGDRVQKINAFLDKVRLEKKRLKTAKSVPSSAEKEQLAQKSVEERQEAIKMAKQFKNKIKVQQDIIDLQRIKLERQERMILQLKLNKLSEEAKEAREDLKQELKTVIRCGDPKAKAKAKCLQLIGSLRDAEDEEMARLQGKALLQPRFLQHMQERALERSIKHEQARQRRAQADAEREAAKMALEDAKRQEDEEAKRLRIEVLKEKRRQEKMAKILKERERQRFIENQRKALEFSRLLLLRRVGMEGFKRLLQRKRDNLAKCLEFRRQLYMRNYFVAWRDYTAYRQREKMVKAEQCHERALKRSAFVIWCRYVQEERSKMLVAIDWHALHATEHWFMRWLNYTTHCKLTEDTKMRQAISHHEWHLKWKVLDCWQRLPQILQLERETEERRQRWRMKIWELLPDYKPRENSLW